MPFAGTLEDILRVQEKRQVGNDDIVRYQRHVLQIPADRHRRHYVKASVRVHEYPDGTLAVFHGPRRLARYSASGILLAEASQRAGVMRFDVTRPVDLMGYAAALPTTPQAPQLQSGQFICYLSWSIPIVGDTPGRAA